MEWTNGGGICSGVRSTAASIVFATCRWMTVIKYRFCNTVFFSFYNLLTQGIVLLLVLTKWSIWCQLSTNTKTLYVVAKYDYVVIKFFDRINPLFNSKTERGISWRAWKFSNKDEQENPNKMCNSVIIKPSERIQNQIRTDSPSIPDALLTAIIELFSEHLPVLNWFQK